MSKRIFEEYFSFSVSEKRSILVVSILIIIGLVASYIIKQAPIRNEVLSEKQLSEIYELVTKLSKTEGHEKITSNSQDSRPRTLFRFDPNTATTFDFEKLGFSRRQINTIENYLNAGGKFYKKQDFKKIYNISEEEYTIYEPYISIKSSDGLLKGDKKKQLSIKENLLSDHHNDKLIDVELNSADTFSLTLLKGIGEVYATRIVKFRELLGGFYKEEQLLDVYGINDTIFKQLQPQIKIDTSVIRTIDLNNASYKDLIRHPYLDSYYTKAILEYRKFKKKDIYKTDLLKDNVLSKEVYSKIHPYLIP